MFFVFAAHMANAEFGYSPVRHTSTEGVEEGRRRLITYSMGQLKEGFHDKTKGGTLELSTIRGRKEEEEKKEGRRRLATR